MPGGGAIRGEVRFRVSLKSRGLTWRVFFCFYFAILSISCSKLSLSLRAGILGISFDSYVFFSFLISTGRMAGADFLFFSSIVSTLGCFILFVVYYFLPLYIYPFFRRIYILTATTNALAWCSHAYFFCPFFLSCFLFYFYFYFISDPLDAKFISFSFVHLFLVLFLPSLVFVGSVGLAGWT